MPLFSFKHFWLLNIFFFCFSSSSNSITLTILPANVTLFGDAVASFKNNTIILTRDHNCTSPATPSSAAPVSGIGRAFYMNPIRFLDPSTKAAASFHCEFSFSITPSPSCPYGDGFAFVITSNKDSLNHSEGYMGLPKQPLGLQDSFLAVEFNTSIDPSLDNINGSHVGINVNSLKPLAAITDASRSVDLKGGHKYTAWIEYNDSRKMIRVWLSNSPFSRLSSPVLVAQVDLSLQFKEFLHIGFSASNAKGSAVYTVEQWDFETFTFQSSSRSNGHGLSGFFHHHVHIWVFGLLLAFGVLAAMICIFTASFLAVR